MGSNLSLIGIVIIIVLQIMVIQKSSTVPNAPTTIRPSAELSAEVKAYIDARPASAVNCVTDEQVKSLMAELAKRERLIADLASLRAQLPKVAEEAKNKAALDYEAERYLGLAREREASMFKAAIAQECAAPRDPEAPVATPAPTAPGEKKTLGKPIFRQNTEEKK